MRRTACIIIRYRSPSLATYAFAVGSVIAILDQRFSKHWNDVAIGSFKISFRICPEDFQTELKNKKSKHQLRLCFSYYAKGILARPMAKR